MTGNSTGKGNPFKYHMVSRERTIKIMVKCCNTIKMDHIRRTFSTSVKVSFSYGYEWSSWLAEFCEWTNHVKEFKFYFDTLYPTEKRTSTPSNAANMWGESNVWVVYVGVRREYRQSADFELGWRRKIMEIVVRIVIPDLDLLSALCVCLAHRSKRLADEWKNHKVGGNNSITTCFPPHYGSAQTMSLNMSRRFSPSFDFMAL